MTPFSVIISLYKNDNPGHFKIAMDSIINQTVLPNETVLTIDGPITDGLNELVVGYESKIKYLKIIRMPHNRGLGIARQIGVEQCSNELIAIMDSDDIAVPYRFERQLQYFEKNPEIDIVGSYVMDFTDNIENVIGIRDVPLKDSDIRKFLKKRCPFTHMTVMFRKEAVIKSGNYQDWHFNEDYYLWCRMFLNGCKFGNIPDVLIYVRVGKDFYNRRGGWKYFISEARLQKYMLDKKIICYYEYIFNVFLRFIVQILMPNTLRGFVFKHFFRRKMHT